MWRGRCLTRHARHPAQYCSCADHGVEAGRDAVVPGRALAREQPYPRVVVRQLLHRYTYISFILRLQRQIRVIPRYTGQNEIIKFADFTLFWIPRNTLITLILFPGWIYLNNKKVQKFYHVHYFTENQDVRIKYRLKKSFFRNAIKHNKHKICMSQVECRIWQIVMSPKFGVFWISKKLYW